MRVFRYSEDRIPVALILGLLVVDLSVYLAIDNVWLLFAWSVLSLVPKAGVCAFNHHSQHVPVFIPPVLNRLIELVFALQTGVSSHAWVLHHSLGHHVHYLDQTKDPSRWARKDGTRMGEFEYAVVTTFTAYPRAWEVGAEYPKQRRIFLVMGLLSLALIGALVAYRPVPGLFVFVLTPFFALFGTAWATYTHHSDRSTDSHMVASNNTLQPFFNWLTCNLGYHTAHHYKPGVHWSRLPALHAEIQAQIPAEAFMRPAFPWTLADPKPSAESPRPVAPRPVNVAPPGG